MKRIMLSMLLVVLFCGLAQADVQTSYVYQPSPTDLYDLEHSHYYAWQIAEDLPVASIVSARLEIFGIYNYNSAPNKLFINLMSQSDVAALWTLASGDHVYSATDTQSAMANNLTGTEITSYTDPDGGWSNRIDYVYDFTQDDLVLLQDCLDNDAMVALGFDPDCHFYNNGVKLTMVTPEPATLLVLGLGAMAIRRRKRSQS